MEKNDFDFWYILPKHDVSQLSSRKQPKINSEFFDTYPFISSPMKAISGSRLVSEMGRLNCLGILHRFETIENRKKMIDEVCGKTQIWGTAIGVENFPEEYEIAKYAYDRGCRMIVVDVSNGYMQKLKYIGAQLSKDFPLVGLMSGNVITQGGANHLTDCGFEFVRVGIGGGSNCKTREVTGIGRNNIAAIRDVDKSNVSYSVADGGITDSGKAVKAFSAGADFCMLGRALAHAEEADNDGTIYGMASERNHIENGKSIKSIEGFESKVEKERKPLSVIIDEFLWGVRSACTYTNSWSYLDLKNNTIFERVEGE